MPTLGRIEGDYQVKFTSLNKFNSQISIAALFGVTPLVVLFVDMLDREHSSFYDLHSDMGLTEAINAAKVNFDRLLEMGS